MSECPQAPQETFIRSADIRGDPNDSDDPRSVSPSPTPRVKKVKVESAEGLAHLALQPPDGTFVLKDIIDRLDPQSLRLIQVWWEVLDVIEKVPELSSNAPVVFESFKARLSDLKARQGLLDQLKKLEQLGDFRGLIINDLFYDTPLGVFEPESRPIDLNGAPTNEQEEATLNSWKAPFVKAPLSAVQALVEHVVEFMKIPEKIYAPCCPIIQSSGTGKSRLLDEFAKTHFSIPINLRDPSSGGFPPADVNLRTYLTYVDHANENPDQESYTRIYSFPLALLEETKRILKSFGNVTREMRITLFRAYMARDQATHSVGDQRRAFYDAVLERAQGYAQQDPRWGRDKEMSSPSKKRGEDRLKKTALALKDVLCDKTVDLRSDVPDIFITFDEAHELMTKFKGTAQSNFGELRRALRMLSGASTFVFFMSTNSKISEFAPTWQLDSSQRIGSGSLTLLKPFSAIGFDQLMNSRKIGQQFRTIEEVTSMECIAHMGRPLWGSRYDNGSVRVRATMLDFAQSKLLCATNVKKGTLTLSQKFAVLSQRLPLDINSTQYTGQPPSATDKAHEQVESHMRVCLEVSQGHEYMISTTASEPILSEAASLIMRSDAYGFYLPHVLQDVLTGYSIDQEDRGELLVASFFIWARDQVAKSMQKGLSEDAASPIFSVDQLLSQLFFRDMQSDQPSFKRGSRTNNNNDKDHGNHKDETFRRILGRTKMHFNHFAQALEKGIFREEYMLGFLSRGAAAMGAGCQPGVDLVIPYLYGDDHRVDGSAHLGYILVQVKLYGQTVSPSASIFKKMDPFELGLLDREDPTAGKVPIIRIVFSLGDTEPGLKQMFYDDPTKAAHVPEGKDLPFTSFDYWCCGMGKETLKPVDVFPETWKALKIRARQWDFPGEAGEATNEVLRAMYPLGETSLMHWSSWIHLSRGRQADNKPNPRRARSVPARRQDDNKWCFI
ncbi:hypothetical protein BC834DRAFT_972056 [Gloeopeniophorella convolvens]|nr:hypothetical protein BC834DRAFT_972056 [Gloeopeniophorella convolvens]